LVNKAVQDLVLTQHDERTWALIKEKAGVRLDAFVQMEPYPDEVTYHLVAAAAEVLQTPPELILEAFGYHWVTYTAEEGYGDLLHMFGDSLSEFLHNLDNLHARVGMTYSKLCPPSFVCDELDESTLRLHYWSEREGLGPMMIGLLRGLSDRFEVTTEVSWEQRKGGDVDHDTFLIKLLPG